MTFTVIAIAFTLLIILGVLLPRSQARHIINRIGAEILSLPLTISWLLGKRGRRKGFSE